MIMPIDTIWDDEEKTIIRKVFSDPWTWDDYRAALDASNALMAEVPDKIGIILDLTGSRSVPANPLHHVRDALGGGMPDNWLVTVVVGSTVVNALGTILGRGMAENVNRVTVAKSLDAARYLIEQRRE